MMKNAGKYIGNLFIAAMTALSATTVYAQTGHYEWYSLPFGGAGFVSGIITCPQEPGVVYARTDVGGAYRWDAGQEAWQPITDFLGADKTGLMGVESLAIDPSSPNKVYMYCGTSYWNNGLTAMLYSEDYGETFTQLSIVTSLFPAHGNDNGRQSGERLAVCPAGGQLLLCGSRTRGLWKSENSGKTWRRMAATTFVNDRKMSFVQFIDSATVVAGMLYKGGDNLFRSADGGTTWSVIEGARTDYMPHRCRLAPDGKTLYVAYSDSEGPGTGGAGALMKLDLATDTWTDISPQKVSFGDISVAYDNPDCLMTVSMGLWWGQYWIGGDTTWGDQIWISKNGGKTWTNLMESGRSTYSESRIKWLASGCQLHWCGSAQLDPFDSNRAWFTSGNGIVGTTNLWAAKPRFRMCVTGLEETVPLNIVSVTGAPLAVTIGDYDGCLYADVTQYNKRFTPSMGSTGAFAIAARNVKVMLRGAGELYLSLNGGTSWVKKNKPVSDKGISSCAVSAEGTMLIARPSDNRPYYSLDKGATWKELTASPSGTNIFADPVNNNVFYGMNGSTFYIHLYDPESDTFTTKTRTVTGVTGRMCVIDGKAGDVWLPRGSSGVTHLTGCDTGSPTVKNIAMSSCTCIGAGKAKEADGYPSLYIWGRKNAAQRLGLYRSNDMGAKWERINDDLHQFGGPGNAQIVSGDMNEYGRVYMSTVGRGVVCGTFIADKETSISMPAAAQDPSAHHKTAYDLQGRRQQSRPKTCGVYILNGKKTLFR
ncbi:MAG: hypothetical protein K2O17_02185 [Bacteroidaceae bacterium]|nr:hypothetical protein [Bacteroidaceae bacterium]